MRLDVEGVCWSPDGIKKVLDDVELHASPGEFVGIIGPNGSGKSSLLRCIYRALRPDAGTVLLNGKNVLSMKPREAAAKIALVLQETATEFELTVLEIVLMGRDPHRSSMERFTSEDMLIAKTALEKVGMMELRSRPFLTLSGGEKQRCLVARALAQKTRFLILDEPTNHLDIRYALEILDLVRQLKITTIAVLHDLNLAASYCDRLFVMHRGQIHASGAPREVLTPRLLLDVFQVGAIVSDHPVTKKLSITFFPIHRVSSNPRFRKASRLRHREKALEGSETQ
jgi:iron complex transport system ATP-binding protein